MASSKALLLLALLASAAMLATAADQQTHDNKEKMAKDAGVKDWGAGGGSGEYSHVCEYGCCRRMYHGGCQKCCPPGGGRPEVKN
ncbi:hypothetical protein BAE44_0000444 [Dichanthelium oligosanthes]|uniref:Uncharacterized protein n=1 Tax=Dichanthelium oligosanthes TaxID=888268 RepID=A0A1E5WME5_9POAL|nr:hypothetical protein BAE44_0000444 [Dichanthelium oligosanthes]